jgi:hypothetical protein
VKKVEDVIRDGMTENNEDKKNQHTTELPFFSDVKKQHSQQNKRKPIGLSRSSYVQEVKTRKHKSRKKNVKQQKQREEKE